MRRGHFGDRCVDALDVDALNNLLGGESLEDFFAGHAGKPVLTHHDIEPDGQGVGRYLEGVGWTERTKGHYTSPEQRPATSRAPAAVRLIATQPRQYHGSKTPILTPGRPLKQRPASLSSRGGMHLPAAKNAVFRGPHPTQLASPIPIRVFFKHPARVHIP